MSAKKRRASGPPVTKKPRTKQKRTLGQRLRRFALWTTVLGLLGVLAAGAAAFYVYNVVEIPDPNDAWQTQTTNVLYSGGDEELGQFATQNRESIPLAEIPKTMQDAVVAAENRTFWTDPGVDLRGIIRATWNNVRGNPTQGASTITQQYVKLLYLTPEQTLKRKIREAVVSLKLQNTHTKSEILEGYLNTVYYGRGAYGVQAAAQAFFDVPAKKLNLKQSAVLAAVINNPSTFDPANGKDNRQELVGRYGYILDGMLDMGEITQMQHDKAIKKLPKFPEIEAESQYGGQRGHMLSLVRTELLERGFTDQQIDGGGLTVQTTFTPEAMAAAKDGMLAQRPEGFNTKQLHVAVATVEVGTGALRGFYGGQDYLESQINWAVSGGMAGSTFKAFAVAAAISDGFSLTDTYEGNSPIELPGLSIRNQGDTDYGSSVSMIQATQDSVNTAFIDMVYRMDNGPEKVIATAEDMGIPGNDEGDYGIPRASIDLQPVTGVALGTVQVSPINMANAYATIASGGVEHDVHVVEKVTDSSGEVLYEADTESHRALSEDIASDVSYTLQQVVQNGSGTAAQGIDRPAAGKTGTATNDKDQVSSSWFVGYTPQYSTAVMYVRGEGREQLDGWLPEFFGGSYPARTWTDVMGRVMEGLPVEEFPEPAYVDLDDGSESDGGGDSDYTPAPPPPDDDSPEPPKSPEPSPREPTPTQQPSPTPPEPTQEPEPTEEPEPTKEPTPTPPSPTPTPPSPTPTPKPTPNPPGDGGGAGAAAPVGAPARTPVRAPEEQPLLVPWVLLLGGWW